MSLVEFVRLRDRVDEVCKGIDAGELYYTDEEIVAMCVVIVQELADAPELLQAAGRDLLLRKLALRCPSGRQALKRSIH
jgi:hypothetical protein